MKRLPGYSGLSLADLQARSPGPSGAAFDPADTHPTLWVEADGLTYQAAGGAAAAADGDPVGQIQDRSGNGHHLAGAAAGNKPVLKTGILNGLPVVRFDGADDFLQVNFTLAQPIQIVLIYRIRVPSPGAFDVDGGAGGTMVLREGAGGTVSLESAPGYEGLVQVGGLDDGNFHCLVGTWDGAGSTLARDGGTPAVGGSGPVNAPGGLTLGGVAGSGAVPSAIDVYACLLFAPPVAAEDLAALQNYYAARTGLAITADAGYWAFYGDSITQGNAGASGWCGRVASARHHFQRNAGVSGSGVRYFGANADAGEYRTADVTAPSPAALRVIVLYGSNDAAGASGAYDAAAFGASYLAMITALAAGLPAGTKINCLAMLAADAALAPTRAANRASVNARIAAAVAALASADVTYHATDGWIDATAGVDTADGVHPNNSGNLKIATQVLTFV